MELDLVGRRVLVTGASSGIGLATVAAFAGEGSRVAAVSRTGSADLAELAAKHGVLALTADLTNPDAAGRAVADAVAGLGSLDVLVNNVGGASGREGFAAFTDDDWLDAYDRNVLTTVRVTRAALPALLEGTSPSITNIASVNARLPFPSIAAYSAAKAALVTLTKALSEEYAGRGLRANTVSPGPVLTPAWTRPGSPAALAAEGNGVTVDDVLAGLPGQMGLTLGRMIDADEVAAAVVFLASTAGGAVTGTDLVVDAGMVKAV